MPKRTSAKIPADKLQRLYRRQYRGALFRSIASITMWSFALTAYLIGIFEYYQFLGISLAVLYLNLMNVPALIILKRITRLRPHKYFSLFINELEIIGYTAIIYFCGGIEAPHLALIYACLIGYIGVVAPRSFTLIIAGLCCANFGIMVGLVSFGFIPDASILHGYTMPGKLQLMVFSVCVGFLYVVTYLSSSNAVLLKDHRRRLSQRNKQLEIEINERKEAEKALRFSEEKWRTTLESIDEGYYELDMTGSFSLVNDSMGEILEYSQHELPGMRSEQYLNHENQERLHQALAKIRESGKPVESLDLEVITKDKRKRHVETSLSVIRDVQRRPIGYRGILRDITERKQMEEALQKSHDDLEKRVQERTKALARSNELLRQEINYRKYAQAEAVQAKEAAEGANRAKSEFLANMSHELRTPLNHIIGFTEVVVDKKFGDLNNTQEEYLGDALESAKHLLSLINDVLDLSKVEAGKLELEISDVNIKSLLENSLNIFKPKAFDRDISLSIGMDNLPEIIKADERKLKQIFYNLLSNAVKFTKHGGEVHLEGHAVDHTVDSFLSEQRSLPGNEDSTNERTSVETEKCLEFSVSDTGIGIKSEDQRAIFRPFEQVDSSASRRYMGTGLGLTLTKRLVELHGGKIWVESRGEGRGSTFRFYIPM